MRLIQLEENWNIRSSKVQATFFLKMSEKLNGDIKMKEYNLNSHQVINYEKPKINLFSFFIFIKKQNPLKSPLPFYHLLFLYIYP